MGFKGWEGSNTVHTFAQSSGGKQHDSQRWTAAGSTGLREEAEFSWDLWIRDGDESPGGSVQRTVGDTRL